MDRRPLIVLGAAVLAAMLSFAYASVFAYAPIGITVSPVAPPVQFREGSNANQPDLGSNNYIEVSIGDGNASLSITVHPTFYQTYYRNVSYIENTDSSKAYNVTIKVKDPLKNLPSGSQAYLLVYDSLNNKVAQVDLLTTSTNNFIIPNGSKFRIDLYFNIPESASPPGPTSASVQLIYTPSNEPPPEVPP